MLPGISNRHNILLKWHLRKISKTHILDYLLTNLYNKQKDIFWSKPSEIFFYEMILWYQVIIHPCVNILYKIKNILWKNTRYSREAYFKLGLLTFKSRPNSQKNIYLFNYTHSNILCQWRIDGQNILNSEFLKLICDTFKSLFARVTLNAIRRNGREWVVEENICALENFFK